MRNIMLLLILSSLFLVGCEKYPNDIIILPDDNDLIETNLGELSILSWNLQIFGQTKASKPEVVQKIVDTINGYDLITLQEIRDAENTAYLSICNKIPVNYKCIISDRTGRTTSKEAYLIIYDETKIMYQNSLLLNDPNDIFERDVFEFRFVFNNTPLSLVSTHVKPDDAEAEINELINIYNAYGDDVIIAGDLNSDCTYFDEDSVDTSYWYPKNNADTTVKSTHCTYDRFLTSENVLDYGIIEGINEETSDHYPIWIKIKVI